MTASKALVHLSTPRFLLARSQRNINFGSAVTVIEVSGQTFVHDLIYSMALRTLASSNTAYVNKT
jgi:hypothetical protein